MKKHLCLLFTLCLLLLPACRPAPVSDAADARLETVSHVYRGEFPAVPPNLEPDTATLALSGDYVSFHAVRLDTEDRQAVICAFPLNGGEAKLYPLPQQKPAESARQKSLVWKSSLGADGSAAACEYHYDYDTREVTYCISLYDRDGALLFSESLADIRRTPGDVFEPESLLCAANGNLYISSSDAVLAIDRTGKLLYEAQTDRVIRSLAATADGRVYVRLRDAAWQEHSIRFLDDSRRGFAEPILLPDLPGMNDLHVGEGYALYLQSDDGLFAVNADDAEPTMLCSWLNSDVDIHSVRTLRIVDADTFVCLEADSLSGGERLAIMHRVPEDEVQPRYLIHAAVLQSDSYFTAFSVQFNRQSDTYRIVTADYSQYSTPEDRGGAWKQLQSDILAGKIPDVVYSPYYEATLANLADKGVFADLYPFIEGDRAFAGNLLDSVIKPFSRGGKLYQLPSTFTLSGYLGKTDNLPKREAFTMDTFLDMAQDCAAQGKSIAHMMSREETQDLLLTSNPGAFIDYDSARCSFTSDTFLRLIRCLETLPLSHDLFENFDGDVSRMEELAALRDNSILLRHMEIGAFRDLLLEKIRFLEDDITFLGYPAADGGTPVISGAYTFSVAEASPVKGGAWEFVKFMLSDTVTDSRARSAYEGFPVTKSGLQTRASREMESCYIVRLDRKSYRTIPWDGENIPEEYDPETEAVTWLSREDADELIRFLEKSRYISDVNAGADAIVRSVINEELAAFYAGNASAEDAAARIQSRVGLYLSEQS